MWSRRLFAGVADLAVTSRCQRRACATLAQAATGVTAAAPNLPPGVFDALTLAVPSDSFVPVTDVYAALGSAERTAIRKSAFKLLGKVLAALPTEFEVSGDGLFVRRLGGPDVVRGGVVPPKPEMVVVAPPPKPQKLAPVAAVTKKPRVPVVVATPTFGGKVKYVDVGQEAVSGAVLVTPPPPPPDNKTGTSGKPDNFTDTAADQGSGTTLSTQMMAAFLPTYFVPMDEVVPTLPDGYTAEHIEQLFSSTNAIQIVTVMDRKFARFIGGYRNHRNVDLLDDPYADAVDAFFSKYRPDPNAIRPFLPNLEPKGEWKALFHVVTKVADPNAAAALRFEGPFTLLYFAQMQHLVAFSPANGGGLCVPMRPVTTLTWESSPVPRSCHAVWKALEGFNATPLDSLWTLLPSLVRDELTLYFGADSVSAEAEVTGGVAMPKHRGWAAAPAGESALPAPRPPGQYDDTAPDEVEEAPDLPPVTAKRGWGSATEAVEVETSASDETLEHAAPQAGEANESHDPASPQTFTTRPQESTGKDNSEGSEDGDDEYNNDLSPPPPPAQPPGSSPTESVEEATLRRFVSAHGGMFALLGRRVLLAFEVAAYERQNMTLEEQLNVALERRNNTLARKIKRKMTVLAQPDNPLLDEANLAKAIAGFLPPDRPLPWKALKNVLPSEVLDLIPIKRGKKFFESYPELFKVYEVHHAGRKVIQRGDLPAPDGVLRGEGAFSEDELLRLVAQELSFRPRSVSSILSRLPIGVERTLTKSYGGVAQFCQRHPQHFSVVVKDAKNNDLRTAILTLLSPPPAPGDADSSGL